MTLTMLADGKPLAATGSTDIHDPATGVLVGQAPVGDAAAVDAAVAAARRAFVTWGRSDDAIRAAACIAIADAIEAHAGELAVLLTREQGKPLNGLGSRFEIDGCVGWSRYMATLSLPVEILQDDDAGRIVAMHKPLGVVASITPWNWPLLIAMWHILPAVRSGCTVVVKPSPYTPLSTLRLVAILNGVLPPGVVNVVTGGDDLGPLLTGHRDVAKIMFTGSTATGKRVMAAAAGTLKRVTLELGGNDAGIVLPDVDPAAIAPALFWGAFINGGQTCAALKRLYVHADIYDAVCAALADFAATVKVGVGLDDAVQLGPVQNVAQLAKVRCLVDDALSRGARTVFRGSAPDSGLFHPVMLIADATDGMALVDEEQFGPVLPIIRYTDIEDAIASANRLEMGLGASVWSRDVEAARAIGDRLESGTCWINAHGGVRPDVPFGGVKSSGIGVSFGQVGLLEFTTHHVING